MSTKYGSRKKSSGPEEISWKIAEYTKYPRDKNGILLPQLSLLA